MPKITLGQERREAKAAAETSPVSVAVPPAGSAKAADWLAWAESIGQPVDTKKAAVAIAKGL